MLKRYIAAVVVVGLAGIYAGTLRSREVSWGQPPPLEQVPAELKAWVAQDVPDDDRAAEVLGADKTVRRVYHRIDGAEVWFCVAYFAQQQVNSQIHSPRNCIPGGGWKVESVEQKLTNINGASQPVTRMLIAKNDRAQEVLYWFHSGGKTVTGEYALKWDLVKRSLARRSTNAAFVRYNAALSDSAALRELMAALQPSVTEILLEADRK